MKKIPIF